LAFFPDYADAHNNIGNLLMKEKQDGGGQSIEFERPFKDICPKKNASYP